MPIVGDPVVAFTDTSQTTNVEKWTSERFGKLAKPSEDSWFGCELRGSFWPGPPLSAVEVFLTLAIFNITLALFLALTTVAAPHWLDGQNLAAGSRFGCLVGCLCALVASDGEPDQAVPTEPDYRRGGSCAR